MSGKLLGSRKIGILGDGREVRVSEEDGGIGTF